jgi:hypothetical protein
MWYTCDACMATPGQSEDATWAIDRLHQHLLTSGLVPTVATDRSQLQRNRHRPDQTISSATDRPTATWRKVDHRYHVALKSTLCSSFNSHLSFGMH